MLSAYEGQFKKTKTVLCPTTNISESANCYLLGKSPGRKGGLKGWRRSWLWASAVGASAQTQLLWRPPRGQQALLPAPPVPSSPQRADFHFFPNLLSPREPNLRDWSTVWPITAPSWKSGWFQPSSPELARSKKKPQGKESICHHHWSFLEHNIKMSTSDWNKTYLWFLQAIPPLYIQSSERMHAPTGVNIFPPFTQTHKLQRQAQHISATSACEMNRENMLLWVKSGWPQFLNTFPFPINFPPHKMKQTFFLKRTISLKLLFTFLNPES